MAAEQNTRATQKTTNPSQKHRQKQKRDDKNIKGHTETQRIRKGSQKEPKQTKRSHARTQETTKADQQSVWGPKRYHVGLKGGDGNNKNMMKTPRGETATQQGPRGNPKSNPEAKRSSRNIKKTEENRK